MTPGARRGLLFVLLAASIAYHIARAALSITALADPAAFPGADRLPFRLKSMSPVVASVTDTGAAAGLKAGDVIQRLADRPLRGFGDLGPALAGAAKTGVLSVEVTGPDGPRTLALSLEPLGDTSVSLGAIASVAALDILLPLFLLGVGFTVVWWKTDDVSAWALLLMMETFSNLGWGGGQGFVRLGPVFGGLSAMWLEFLRSCWSLSMVAFIIRFPEPLPLDLRRPWIKWLLFGPILGGALVVAGMDLGYVNFAWSVPFASLWSRISRVSFLLIYLSVSVFYFTLGLKLGTTKTPDALRRLKILLIGAGVGLSPAGLIASVALFTGKPYGVGIPDTVNLIAVLMMLIFPLTLAYVVIVHKAMGVGMVIRQGLQYALAQRTIRLIQVLTAAAVVWGLLDLLSVPGNRRVDRLQWISLAVLFLALVRRGARRLQAGIDQRFFREAVDAEQILAELGERVRMIADRKDLLETVSQKIAAALHIPKVAAFVRGDGGFVPAFATGYGGGPLGVEFGQAAVLTCCVAALQKPQTVYLGDHRSWVRRENIPDAEAQKLRDLESEVLIPLRTKTSVEGFLSLGPKASEAAYSPSDLQLLQSVAHQTALALDNTRLVEEVASEVAKRERMTREIEIAREVQFTLLPQEPPRVSGLDLAGQCRPAAGVGGDYYDFIPLEGPRAIGLAIGDIAGKGIPAALLMAGLQAALRGQTLAGSRDLARIMANINKLIFESSPSNRYATFFYGEYRDGTLAYVNAGHNAPMLLRKAGGIERLESGGPVIGLMDAASFVEASVSFEPGDVLLGYTDGVSECMNPQDEEWGEDQLMEVLRRSRGQTATTLATSIVTAADAYANGAKQHDDMTVIVMKAA